MKDALRTHGLDTDKVTAVPMGVDLEAMDSDVQALGAKLDPRLAGRPVVVYLGSLDQSRQPEIMIDAMSIVRTHVPNVLLVLIGDSGDARTFSALEQRVVDNGLSENVLLLGWKEPAVAWAYVRSAAVGLSVIPPTELFIVSSPTKVIEYLACGVPTVASDIPDQRDLILPSGGGYCVEFSAGAVAYATVELLRDPTRAMTMGQKASLHVRQARGYTGIAKALSYTYTELCSTPG